MRLPMTVIMMGFLLTIGCSKAPDSQPLANAQKTANKATDPKKGDPPSKQPSGPLKSAAPGKIGPLLTYIYSRMGGQPADEKYEAKSLARDLEIDTLDLAELISAQISERRLPEKAALQFMEIPVDGATSDVARAEPEYSDPKKRPSLAKLTGRVRILASPVPEEKLAEGFKIEERRKLLMSGVVGDPREVGAIHETVTVQFLVNYCRGIETWCREHPK